MKKVIYPELAGEFARHGKTQKDVANILGITDVSLSRKMKGKSDWTISEIEKLCDFFSKDYYELFKKNN